MGEAIRHPYFVQIMEKIEEPWRAKGLLDFNRGRLVTIPIPAYKAFQAPFKLFKPR